jgi:hypothetical protein
MARINAHKATEVARITATFGRNTRLFIMTSDGRVLTRFTKPSGTNYNLLYRNLSVPSKAERRRSVLIQIANRMGYKLEETSSARH